MTTRKGPTEYIKALIAIFCMLISGLIVWLFSSVSDLKQEMAVQKTETKFLKEALPKVTEALENHTEAINSLKIAIERLKP